MRPRIPIALILVVTSISASCADRSDEGGARRVEISVAPFDLVEVTDATYMLTLRNGDGDIVWVKENISSSRYGDGHGSMSYVGTCDPTTSPNSLELVLVDLYQGTAVIPASEFVNPCPLATPCVLPVTCSETGETQPAIEFNLTIAMSSLENKGFFDIAVRFSDLFCSSQFSCRDELLFVDSRRAKTHVLGFACVSGVATQTHLYVRDVFVTCAADSTSLDPSLEPGNHAGYGPVGAWAIFRGNETLPGMRKGYWNIAIALAASATDCHVSAEMTASEGAFTEQVTPVHTTYPIITLDFDVGDATGICHATQQLDAAGSGVQTTYTDIGESLCFEHVAEVKSTGLSVESRSCP